MNRVLMVLMVSVFALAVCSPSRSQEAKPSQKDADVKTLVQGNNEFAFDLYARLAEKPGNKFFSPYSISTALAMTFAGARGNTAKESIRSRSAPCTGW